MATLVELVRTIDDIEPSASDDLSSRALLEARKADLIKSIFESNKYNQAVQAVNEGKGRVTFTQLYKKSFADVKIDQDLAECIGHYNPFEPHSIGFDAGISIIPGFILGIGGSAVISKLQNNTTFSRRNALNMLYGLAAGGLLGGVVGLVGGKAERILNSGAAKNAEYLDSVYSRVYKTTSATIEHSPLVQNYFQRFGISNRA